MTICDCVPLSSQSLTMKFLYVLAALLVMTQVIQVEAILGLIALKAGAIGYALGRSSG